MDFTGRMGRLTTLRFHGRISNLFEIILESPLANTAQARKRARQALVRREKNFSQKSQLRTTVKSLLKAVQAGDKAAAKALYQTITSLADKAVRKKLIHANKAARIKSRLAKRVR